MTFNQMRAGHSERGGRHSEDLSFRSFRVDGSWYLSHWYGDAPPTVTVQVLKSASSRSSSESYFRAAVKNTARLMLLKSGLFTARRGSLSNA